MQLSQRALSIRPSATLELSARAKQLREDGKDVLNLTAGEPDLPTPQPIVEAAHRALDEGCFHYTPTAGVPALRRTVAGVYSGRLDMEIHPEEIVVSNGAKQALYNAMATVTDPGDRIGVLNPAWVSYVEQAHALGCIPVRIPCPKEGGFRPDLEILKQELEKGLKLIIVNSPCNPTGVAFQREDWKEMLSILEGYPTFLISDEIYEDIVFTPGGHWSPIRCMPSIRDRCCLVSGLSKAYAMTGWRVGYSIAPAGWSKAMASLQGHLTSNINAVTQQAAIHALEHHELVAPLTETFRQRKEQVFRRMGDLEGVVAREPQGSFYLYMDMSEILQEGRIASDIDALAKRLLDESLVALVPGSAFGDPDHLRLSFAASSATLDAAFDRLARVFR